MNGGHGVGTQEGRPRPEVSIIIVNWNGLAYLRGCLRSIGESRPIADFEVIVVDNASSDESVRWLRSGEADALLGGAPLRVIANAENVGFGRANNQGMALSDAPFVFLLNSDAELELGSLDRLLETLRSDERYGAAGPKMLNTDGSLQVSVSRNPPVFWEILLTGLRLERFLPARIRGELLLGGHWNHAERRVVPTLHGAAFLARRAMVDEVGGFDEAFHMYGEDVEWCYRITQSGWWLVFEPVARVVHHGGGSSSLRWRSDEQWRVMYDGNLRFQESSLPRVHLLGNLLANCFVLNLKAVWRRLRRRPDDDIGMVLEIARDVHWRYLRRALLRPRGMVAERGNGGRPGASVSTGLPTLRASPPRENR